MFWSGRITLAESTDWHVHEAYELLFCHAGAGRLSVEERVIDLHPLRMVLVTPGTRHRIAFDAGQFADLKVVCMTGDDTARYLSPVQSVLLDNLQHAGCAVCDQSAGLPMLADLVTMIPDGSVDADRRERLLVWSIISLLLACQGHATPQAEPQAPSHRGKIEDVCAWLDRHLDSETALDEIAAEFGLSRSLLTRMFRRHTGTSIVHYVNSRRLEKAAALLTSPRGGSITQAALESGFTNLSNFHRRFKAAYGLTPAEFRRNFAG